ncbi:hypothetical protein HYU22_01180 [Candidatus Woesearchaeota archaeon]|nr:hypothetical protein [Candidatus Woesearchaeota archaeon]
MTPLKMLGYMLVALLVLNIISFSLRIIGAGVFWIVLLVGAVCAFIVVPWWKKRG